MFAVKGWAVDASGLKAQTEPFKTGKIGQDGEQRPSRKRKRENNVQQREGDVGKMWDQHIEGKAPVKGKKDKKKDKKSKKGKDGEKPNKKAKMSNGPETGANAQAVSRKREKVEQQQETPQADTPNGTASSPPPVPPVPATAKLTPMQAAMRQKLISARFRHLNETLYTAPSDTALQLFDTNPEMFEDYHAGFRQQVTTWPENPIDNFITTIRTRAAIKPPRHPSHKDKHPPPSTNPSSLQPLPRTQGTCIIADLGCGDARLASTLTAPPSSKLNLKILSYDLHSPSPLVTKADISNLPQADGSVDIAIFCLALMGTNWISFVEEAYRILHWKGELWVAEIKSRFGRVGAGKGRVVEHSVGSKRKVAAVRKVVEKKVKEAEGVEEEGVLRSEVDGVEEKGKGETDVAGFVEVLRRRGFVVKEGGQGVDLGNKMFVKMEFVKAAPAVKGKNVLKGEKRQKFGKKKFIEEVKGDVDTEDEAKVLKPCLYKIR